MLASSAFNFALTLNREAVLCVVSYKNWMMKMCLDRTVFVQFIGRKTRRTHNNTHTRHTTRSLVTTAKRPLTKRRAKSSRLGAALFTFSRQEALKYTTRQTKKKRVTFYFAAMWLFRVYYYQSGAIYLAAYTRNDVKKKKEKNPLFTFYYIIF